ncbi:hypothetical protein [Methylobacterium trifolii]|uniref:Uncharacterized protein n=1 Tax=Methylobacterium trifolii TaxID=1003092 RepID=A0ABQ4U1F8_9HYPH|nr:hypothetical protein [Methylobacterium trifolii]GJE60984.1 hypothetical protein MPOCJGCO_3103 [Methylobacterium trifolii]
MLAPVPNPPAHNPPASDPGPRLPIRTGAAPAGKEAAIREADQSLTAAGCIAPAHGAGMLRREGVARPARGPRHIRAAGAPARRHQRGPRT